MTSHYVCETSLRWILAARRYRSLHKYDKYIILYYKYREVLEDNVSSFYHTDESLSWTLAQAKRIDEIGLYEWLKTDDARGYQYICDKHPQLK